MSDIVRGVVGRTFSKDFGSGKLLHSFVLKGQDGFFGTGYRKAVEEGKSYEFEVSIDAKGRKNVDLSTLRPWESGEAIQAAPAKTFRVGTGGGFKGDPAKDEYWKNKELRDVNNDRMRELGATRNTALTLVSLMLANGAVKLPPKEANREEVIYQLFEHYTDVLMKGKQQEDSPKDEVSEAIAEAQSEDASWK